MLMTKIIDKGCLNCLERRRKKCWPNWKIYY